MFTNKLQSSYIYIRIYVDRRQKLFLTNEPLKVLKTSIKYNRVDAAHTV